MATKLTSGGKDATPTRLADIRLHVPGDGDRGRLHGRGDQPEQGKRPSGAPSELEMAVGHGASLAAAGDGGALAATQINDFGFDLLRHLDSKGNLVASPTSIALALAMARPGAKGQTAMEMDNVLHGFGADGLANETRALLETLARKTIYLNTTGAPMATPASSSPEPAVELDISNQAFIQKGYDFEAAYLDALSSSFNAGVGLVDYKRDPEAARVVINRWASEQTKGRIPSILNKGDLDNLTRLVLVNAIYLKAAWADEFDPKETADRPFTTAAGTRGPSADHGDPAPLRIRHGTWLPGRRAAIRNRWHGHDDRGPRRHVSVRGWVERREIRGDPLGPGRA